MTFRAAVTIFWHHQTRGTTTIAKVKLKKYNNKFLIKNLYVINNK